LSVQAGLRRWPLLTRLLFGVDIAVPVGQNHWDYSTLVLKAAILRYGRVGMSMLDVGTGGAGLLAIYAAKRQHARVTAVDVREEALNSARRVAAANDAVVEFRRSDLLSAIREDEHFDLITFNPPYVPTEVGRARGLARKEPPEVWDGGHDGSQVLARFLDVVAPRVHNDGSRALVGFNRRHVPVPVVAQRVADCGLVIEDILTRHWNPSAVLVIGSTRARPEATRPPARTIAREL